MGGLHKTAASIGFFGDDLDPVEITTALGAEPTVGVRKGGVWHTKAGVEKVASQGSWRVEAERREPGDLTPRSTSFSMVYPTTFPHGSHIRSAIAAEFFAACSSPAGMRV